MLIGQARRASSTSLVAFGAQPLPGVNQHRFTAPAERLSSRISSSMASPLTTRIAGGLEGCGALAVVAVPPKPIPLALRLTPGAKFSHCSYHVHSPFRDTRSQQREFLA